MQQHNLLELPEVWVAILALVLASSAFYFLGWQRGHRTARVDLPEEVIGAEEFEPQFVPSIEMHAVLEPTTGPIDIINSPLVHRSEIDSLRAQVARLEALRDRHWRTIKRLRYQLRQVKEVAATTSRFMLPAAIDNVVNLDYRRLNRHTTRKVA